MTSAIENSSRTGVFWTPPPKWETPPAAAGVPVMPCSENNARRSLYHAHYKVPPGDSPYGIAKRAQLVEKDPSKAVSLFWAAINSGDRVDSALKDMAVIMKQLNRSDEAIEAIKSFRHLCPVESQESLDNVLLELYKKSGKLQEEIQMLRLKLKHIEEVSFRGKRIKVGRSQGRKVHITIEKEYSRLLGNLAWAYLQQKNYRSAEEYYRKALSFEPDRNKQCNLAVCLMHLNMKTEARLLLQAVRTSCENAQIDDSFSRSFNRATQLLGDLESDHFPRPIIQKEKMYGEIQKPFLSCARRNLRRPSEADNGNKLLGSERLRNSKVVHQDEISPVIELKTPSLLQNLHDSNITFSSSFCRGIRHSNGQKEEALTCRKEYDPLFSLAKTPRVLTQPQKCLRLANKCSHGRRSYAEGPDGGCSRKLLFQHENNCESVQFSPYHNVHQYKEPESTRSLTSEDRRKKTLGDLVPKHRKCSMISISVGVWRRDCLEVDEQRKDTKSESSLSSITTFGGYSTRKEEFPECDEDSGRNSTVYRMGLIEAAENGNQIQKSTQKLKSNVEHLQDFPTSKKKKSWADMVEEGDQELLNESKDSLAHEQGFSSGESVVSPKNTPINYSHDNEAGEQFGDENRNPDIILETPCSLNQGESLNQKLKSLVPKDGYYTQPLHSGSSMNHTGRRLFCNDQYRNLDKIQTTFVSPLQKRSLNFI